MTKIQLKASQQLRINRLYNIINFGKIIAVCTFDKDNEYWLYNGIVWYLPRKQLSINHGTLKEFTEKVNSKRIKARFI